MFYYLSTRPKPVMQFRERRRLGLGLRFITYLEERKPDGRTDGRTSANEDSRSPGGWRVSCPSSHWEPIYFPSLFLLARQWTLRAERNRMQFPFSPRRRDVNMQQAARAGRVDMYLLSLISLRLFQQQLLYSFYSFLIYLLMDLTSLVSRLSLFSPTFTFLSVLCNC